MSDKTLVSEVLVDDYEEILYGDEEDLMYEYNDPEPYVSHYFAIGAVNRCGEGEVSEGSERIFIGMHIDNNKYMQYFGVDYPPEAPMHPEFEWVSEGVVRMKSGVGMCNSPSKVEGYGLVVEGGEEERMEFYLKVKE